MKRTILAGAIGLVIGVLCGWLIWGVFMGDKSVVKCASGAPDENGCCVGEEYTIVNGTPACCPDGDGDCFEPISK